MTARDKAAYNRHVRARKQARAERRVEIDGRMVSTEAPVHGKYTTYVNWTCRCEPCTTSFREHMAAQRAKHAADLVDVGGRLIHPRAPHGTEHGYSYWGCRCESCTATATAYRAARIAEAAS